ncbi:GtrA family protein [Microbacterium aquimaris]|nr:GtrA family protein [Microbacterium aquimaris]
MAVGVGAFLIDALVFNLLAFGLAGTGPMYELPLVAKTVAIAIASVVTYIGNRYWTFGRRELPRRWSRYVLFALFNVMAILLQLGCLAFSRYILGLEGPVPDNVAGTLVGQAVATVFRFVTYDRFVFRS